MIIIIMLTLLEIMKISSNEYVQNMYTFLQNNNNEVDFQAIKNQENNHHNDVNFPLNKIHGGKIHVLHDKPSYCSVYSDDDDNDDNDYDSDDDTTTVYR